MGRELRDLEVKGGGLIKRGKPSLLHRIGFVMRGANNDRVLKVGRYLDTRKPGGTFGRGRNRKPRVSSSYTGAYVGNGG